MKLYQYSGDYSCLVMLFLFVYFVFNFVHLNMDKGQIYDGTKAKHINSFNCDEYHKLVSMNQRNTSIL